MTDALLQPIAEALDDLGLAACVFDEADAALLWNRSFLAFFPEHAPFIHAGEPYRANLRRFYEGRLEAAEMPAIERYIEEGILRHRMQQRPYAFEHRGMRLTVASQPLPGVGRIRIWSRAGLHAPQPAGLRDAGTAATPPLDGAGLFEHLAEGIMLTGADDRVLWVNTPFMQMYRLHDRAEALGKRLQEVYRDAWSGVPEAERGPCEEGLAVLAEHLRFAGAPFELPLPGARWSRVVGQRSPHGNGFFAHVDITALKRQHDRLQLAERRARESETQLAAKTALLEATLERMEQGVMMVNPAHVVEVCNRRAIELLGLPAELMASRPAFEAVLAYQWSQGEFAETPADIQQFIRSGGILDEPHCYDRLRPDGRVIEIHSVPIDGGGVLRTYTDITDRRRREEQIRHVARHDGLTSLVNREVFLEQLAAASGHGGGDGFAVHYIDLDRFKPINDRFGHAIGDKVLAGVAARMRCIARNDDVVARMGGDEFAILQLRVERAEAARGLAQRILEGICQPMQIEAQTMAVGASIGIVLCHAGGGDADTLLRRADAAMYAAKASTGERIRVHDEPPPA